MNWKKTAFVTVVLSVLLIPTAYAKLSSVTQAVQAQWEKHARVDFEEFNRTELYFGTNKPDGSVVTDVDWQNFLNTHVTPRFPDGLTVLKGDGQFRNGQGIIVKERSIVLILLYPVQTRRSSSVKIEEIRTLYKQAFQQESVLRADDPLPQKVSF